MNITGNFDIDLRVLKRIKIYLFAFQGIKIIASFLISTHAGVIAGINKEVLCQDNLLRVA